MIPNKSLWRQNAEFLAELQRRYSAGLYPGNRFGSPLQSWCRWKGIGCTNTRFAYNRLFFGRFSGKRRVADLPENWGFWRFFLEFWVNSWVFEQFCLILDKNHKIFIKIVRYFWKICQNIEFLAKNSWVLSFWGLSFSFFHLEFLSECPKKKPGLNT